MPTRQFTMVISNNELKARAQKIRYVFTDVDGTLTDGCVYYSPEGELLKKFSLRDGSGFFLLSQAGVKSGIITGEDSPIVARRAEKLKVDKLIMKAVPKVETLQKFLDSEGSTFDNVAYIGDSFNDVKLMRVCGLSFAVADSDELAIAASHIHLQSKGGNGAFVEAAQKLLQLMDISIEEIIDKSL